MLHTADLEHEPSSSESQPLVNMAGSTERNIRVPHSWSRGSNQGAPTLHLRSGKTNVFAAAGIVPPSIDRAISKPGGWVETIEK
eukprot:3103717-Rhodomonas_salina.1